MGLLQKQRRYDEELQHTGTFYLESGERRCLRKKRLSEQAEKNSVAEAVSEEAEGQFLEKVSQVGAELNIREVYTMYTGKDLARQTPRRFVRKMQEQNVESWYLTGEPEWGLNIEATEICEQILALASYNAVVEPEERFAGMMLDTEPYGLDEWKADKWDVMERWCSALERARQCAAENDILLAVCIPRWLDEISYEYLEWLIRDGADRIIVMNYGKEQEAEAIAQELEIAQRYGKSVTHVSELTPPGQYDLTDKQTYYQSDVQTVVDSWKRLSKIYPNADLHFAYHHFIPLVEMMERQD